MAFDAITYALAKKNSSTGGIPFTVDDKTKLDNINLSDYVQNTDYITTIQEIQNRLTKLENIRNGEEMEF